LASAKLRTLQIAAASVRVESPPATRSMGTKSASSRIRWVAAAAGLLLLVLPFSLSPGVRAAAAELFARFQPRQIKVLVMTEAERARLEQAPSGVVRQLMAQLFPAEDLQEEAEQPTQRLKVEDLINKGFRAPAYVPEGYEVGWSGDYIPGWSVSHPLNVGEINRLLGEIGVEFRLPPGLAAQEFRFVAGDVMVCYLMPKGSGRPVAILQEGPRTFYAPEGVDLNDLYGALLVRMALDAGASPEVVEPLRHTKALETLQVPIVPDRDSAVEVGSATGAFLTRPDRNELVWMKNGITWRILGPLPREEMQKIAQSMQ
jgi:hypothetical protein